MVAGGPSQNQPFLRNVVIVATNVNDRSPMALTEVPALIRETASVAGHMVRLVTDYAEQHGVATAPLLGEIDCLPADLDGAGHRLRFVDFTHLCDRLAQALADPFLGLHAGVQVKPGHLGSLGFVLMSCATVGEALQRSQRYSGMVLDACSNDLAERDGLCIRSWRSRLVGGDKVGRLQDELHTAMWITLARWMINREDFSPTWVSFQHPAPDDVREYARVFRCPVQFAAPETAIAIPLSMRTMALPQANPAIRHILDEYCERLLQQQRAGRDAPTWLVVVKKAILQAFERGGPEPAAVAATAKLSTDELGGLLARHGTSFRALVDELRQELALAYVQNLSLSLADISYLLGFSEQSAFHRAFKRWTGQPPGVYRRTIPR